MKWLPKTYQLSALSFLLTKQRGGLFLDPGLGKTSTSLSALKILLQNESIKGTLLIAPLRVCYSVWPNEIKKWTNFNNITHTILHENNKDSLWGPKKDIYIINPAGLPWLFNELFDKLSKGESCPFDTLLIDESTNFKSYKTTIKKTKRPTRFGYLVNMLSLFKRRYIMTGTPAPKSLLDLWSQAFILDNGKALGSNFYNFRRKYFYTEDWNKYDWKLKEGAAAKIHKAIAPLVLEMSADDYLDIPPIVHNYINVSLPLKAMTFYKKMEKEFFITLDGIEVSAEATAQATMKCHQIANGKVYEDIPEGLTDIEIRKFKKTRRAMHIHDAKSEALINLVNELNGKPLLIAYHYKHDLEAILKTFGASTPYIGSNISATEGKRLEKLWNEGKLPILAGHPASMAHGLNLQDAANDICWYSLPYYDLELYIQFNKRIHRPGVNGKVRVHHLVAKNTLDEGVLNILGERANEQNSLRKALKLYRRKLRSKSNDL